MDNKDSLSQEFNVNDTEVSNSNLGLMKYVDTLFSKYGLLKNLENYILIIITFFYAGSSIVYFRIGSDLLESDMNEILDNKLQNEKKNSENHIRKRKSMKITKNNGEDKIANPQKKRRKRFNQKK